MDYVDFGIRYAVLIGTGMLLLRGVFYRYSRNPAVFFSLFMFLNSIFFVTYFLKTADLSMGFAFGMFALFSLLRYRTEAMDARDVTYLLTVIALSLLCSVAQIEYAVLLSVGLALASLAFLAESIMLVTKVVVRQVVYDRLDLLQPDQKQAFADDMRARSGLQVLDFTIERLDFLRDSAVLQVRCVQVHQRRQAT